MDYREEYVKCYQTNGSKKIGDSIEKLRLLSTHSSNFVLCIGQGLLEAKIVPTILTISSHYLFSSARRAHERSISKNDVNAYNLPEHVVHLQTFKDYTASSNRDNEKVKKKTGNGIEERRLL